MLFKDITVIDESYTAREHQNLVTDGKVISYIGREIPQDYRGEVYDGKN